MQEASTLSKYKPADGVHRLVSCIVTSGLGNEIDRLAANLTRYY